MGLSLEQQDGEWYNALPHRGGIYDQIDAAVYGSGPEERIRAITGLGKSGDPRAVRPLSGLLGDDDPAIRLASAAALGSLRSGRPVDELIERLTDGSEQVAVRRQAAEALAAIRSTGALRGLREFVAADAGDSSLHAFAEDLLRDIGAL